LLTPVRDYGHECKSNREEGNYNGQFDFKLILTEKATTIQTAVIMEFKILKSKNKDDEKFEQEDLQKMAVDGLQQIDKNHDTGLSSSSANIIVILSVHNVKLGVLRQKINSDINAYSSLEP
ncbi:2428_t:CDS:1, partial [Paraglomus occultum]